MRDAGYTDAPPADDGPTPREVLEPDDRATRMALHHASIAPHALGVFPHDDGDAITVVFAYEDAWLARIYPDATERAARLAENGRAVIVSVDAAPRIVHQDALLSHVQTICADP